MRLRRKANATWKKTPEKWNLNLCETSRMKFWGQPLQNTQTWEQKEHHFKACNIQKNRQRLVFLLHPVFFCAAARREPSLQFLGGNMIYLKSLIVHLVNHNTSLPFTYYFCERKTSGPRDFPKNQRSWPWYCQPKESKKGWSNHWKITCISMVWFP